MTTPDEDLGNDPLLHAAPLLEGFKVLEPAVLYAKVGEGGMGSVYRGSHVSLECDVAIKVLKPDFAKNEQFVLRFEREARLAARINSDNVVQVLDVRKKNGIHYLVMEFIKGETARERVQRKGQLAEAEALAILLGATRGLRAAHAAGIVHRDIKPDNVLIGAEGAVKLADLGIAKAKAGSSDQSLTVLASGVMGTPQYMPPEQWRTPDVKPSADVWALGATLWYLLAGRSAIPSGELLVVAERIRDHDFPDLAAVRPDVRPEVVALLAKCTRRDPAERFVDAGELLTALKPLCADHDEVLADAATGSGKKLDALVTPPPRATLAKIKLQIESEQDEPVAEQPDQTPASEQPTVPQRTGREVLPSPGRRGLVPVLFGLLLLVSLGAVGQWAGWFGGEALPTPPVGKADGTQGADPKAQDQPANAPETDPGKQGRPLVGVDAGQRAKAALARGKELLPVKASLDAAIAAFEEALTLDGSLGEARESLVLALSRKARDLEATDPDAAHDSIDRARALLPQSTAWQQVAARVTKALEQRLAAGLSLHTPAADAVLTSRLVSLQGGMTQKVRALRAALVPAAAATEPFPREASTELTIVAEEFDGGLPAAKSDGAFVLRVEAEDRHGLRAELAPRLVTLDTAPPEVKVLTPKAGAQVGAKVTLRGTVQDATKCTVRAASTAATVAADGTWMAELELAAGPQQVVVVATDVAGKESRQELALVVDAEVPTLTFAAEVPQVTKQKQLAIRGQVQDAGGAVALAMDGAPVTVAADGSFVATVSFADEREYEVAFVATDAVGNPTPRSVRVRYDATQPVLEWSEPKDLGVAPGEVTIAGTLRDASAGEVKVNGIAARITGDRWTASVQVAAGGTLAVEVTARDAAGNDAAPLTRTLRAEDPVGTLDWADAAPDSKPVAIDGTKWPSIVIEKQTGMRMVLIPAKPEGFQMGSPTSEPERESDETQHVRKIRKPFWLGETEVRQAEWQRVMNNNPSRYQGPDNPVEQVSWNDCQEFVARLNRRSVGFRLPSEAEWEYSCRAGSTTPFHFGSNITTAQANYDGNHPYNGAGKGEYRQRPLPVRDLPANAFGLYGMHGNVWEWCQDTKTDYPGTGTEEPTRGVGSRVVRGGSWFNDAWSCRSAVRDVGDPTNSDGNVGFRLARTF